MKTLVQHIKESMAPLKWYKPLQDKSNWAYEFLKSLDFSSDEMKVIKQLTSQNDVDAMVKSFITGNEVVIKGEVNYAITFCIVLEGADDFKEYSRKRDSLYKKFNKVLKGIEHKIPRNPFFEFRMSKTDYPAKEDIYDNNVLTLDCGIYSNDTEKIKTALSELISISKDEDVL